MPHNFRMKRNAPLLGAVCAALLSACATAPVDDAPRLSAPGPQTADAVVAEAWISAPVADDELDSVAVWPTEDGGVWLIASAKSSHRLAVYDGDTGQRVRTFGEPGQGRGQFGRPNGIAVFGDTLFVVERDNHRVQVFELPDFIPRGSFGEDQLQVPYGLWLHETGPGELEVLVTDSFMADFENRVLPPMSLLDQRVKRFRLSLEDDALQADYLGAFGDTGENGALRMVESIAGDPVHDRLLIADEDRRVGSTLRDYLLNGSYRGRSLPAFDADAEGVTLWACSFEDGYWVAVDQVKPTLFRLFDRATLEGRGIFSGEQVANTDGAAIHASPTQRFPAGALFALHNDQSLAAFDLRDVVRALHLRDDCGH